ncbi:DUF2613 family protein [Mycobacterium terramassiliense]|uniref:Small secreted protein n=1 Tax=Mycobacterium terramassiliense TaxID=1841859 RepID=A0A2U3NCZ0_9MYCO|nr:DUF2613 family protein [Mycobacterium terramassiliense]SPM29375.1 hypothetical protein MTAB308_2867 [Mycobacterium terramassiliense]
MAGFSLAAAASIAVGLSLGAAATVGVTLAIDDHRQVPSQTAPAVRIPAGPYLVDYGSRCWHGHCVPWP